MKRKVIQLGGSTYVVSLPTRWVTKHKIQKGHEVDVSSVGPILQIASEQIASEHCFSLDIRSLTDEMAIRLLLPVLHKNGYDKIEFICHSRQIPLIQSRINNMLIGYEVIAVTNSSCTIKMISQESNNDFDQLLRRVFLVTLQLAETMFLFLEQEKYEEVKELLVLEKTNNKLTNYVERLINKQVSYKEKHSYLYLITWIQESIADEYKEICLIILQEKKFAKDLLSSLQSVNELLRKLYQLFYSFSFERVEEILQKKKDTFLHMTTLLQSGRPPHELQILFLLFAILQQIEDSIGSVIAYHH